METLVKRKKIVTSKKWSIDSLDIIKSLAIAILTPVFLALQSRLDEVVMGAVPTFQLNWKQLVMIGIAGGISYLVKNFLSPAKQVTQIEDIPLTDAKAILKEEIKKDENEQN